MKEKEYKKILDLNPPRIKNHIPMTRENRAAQFSPFAALTGYHEIIEEEARYVEKKRRLSQEAREELDRKIQLLMKEDKRQEEIELVYFLHDHKKEGGRYIRIRGRIKEIDKKYVKIQGGEEISLEDIWEISFP